MKTKEFIAKVEDLGFKVFKRSPLLVVAEPNYLSEVVTVRIDKMYHLDSRWNHSALDKKVLEQTLNYTADYAKTPLEER